MPRLAERLRRPALVTSYDRDLRLFRSWLARVGLLVLLVLYLLLPQMLDNFWLGVLVQVAIFAIAAVGLNLLTGYTGQVSLGHAFFLAIGAYTWAHFGASSGLPIYVWLPLAGVLGGLVGALVGPFALRLRGNYLAIVSLGLVFIGTHIWNNFESVTGGSSGCCDARMPVYMDPIPFNERNFLDAGATLYSKQQAFFWLTWALLALLVLLAKNIVRTRPGRAMQAVRDRDIAASVIGVDLRRYKVAAFAVSSAYAAVAGALFGAFASYVTVDQWGLALSIQFIAIIIVGGVGTIFGSIVGALFVAALPAVIEEYSGDLPLISSITEAGGLSIEDLNRLVFGLVIILFLVLEPHGLAGVWFRIKAYFRAWPFTY